MHAIEQTIMGHVVNGKNQITRCCPTDIARCTAKGMHSCRNNSTIVAFLYAKNGTRALPHMRQSSKYDHSERHPHDAMDITV